MNPNTFHVTISTRLFCRFLTIFSLSLISAFVFATSTTEQVFGQETLTIATLAPERSSWDKVFKGMADEIEKKTTGRVKIKLFGSGVQGDEELVVQKMRSGQVDGAAITGVGLSRISPNVLVFQVPGIFDGSDVDKGYRELDTVRNKMKTRLEKEFADKGFVLLGWGDVGFVYLFSTVPVKKPGDLQKVKMWQWTVDPIAKIFLEKAGANPVPLGVPDVLPNLDTGLINAYYASPLAAIALRWFGKSKYLTAQPFSLGIGATVVSQKSWDRLSAEDKTAVLEVADKWHKILIKKVRADNTKSLAVLKEKGIEFVMPTDEDTRLWKQLAADTERALVGKVYEQSILDEARKHLAAIRQ
ncbi:MAG: TRAP transporter substrate-binding protein DctP [Myxococcales bacterium]|nr:TRAP transporter substrate-binding protein DctP [Myxococcales bacterium]